MHKQMLTLVLATFALSGVAFAQDPADEAPFAPGGEIKPFAIVGRDDGPFQLLYAANLNIGDSVVNITNDGVNGGFFTGGNPLGAAALNKTGGNICVNTYVFDPQEEEIGCCACLVTPNGLNSLSAKADLISNNLTPAVPTSIVIKLVATTPALDKTGAFTVCNPALMLTTDNDVVNEITNGMIVWGTTLEPAATAGTYNAVNVPARNGGLGAQEASDLAQVCNFIQANGTGYGICKSCRLGALGGSKQ